VVMAAVLRRPRALDQLDAMVEAIELDEDRSSADAVGSVASPAHEGVADDAVGSAGRSRGARLTTELTVSSRSRLWRGCQVRTVTLLAPAPTSTS
jgi:hypothetical protein